MKPIFYLLACSLFFNALHAQTKTIEVEHYVFPKFTPGYVLMKSGEKNAALLNYHSILEEVVFEDGQGKRAIADAQVPQVDTVYIKDRKFFRLNDTFVELAHQSTYDLYIEYKCDVKYPGNVSAFGQTSQTSSNQSFSQVAIRGTMYELSLPSGYKTKPYQYYWIKKDGELNQFKNLNQLLKLYDAKKNAGKAFVKEHKIKMSNSEGILQLIEYLETD
ncbi:hypothetical protein [Flagellimonas sp.]|uniref:hypothetical protein n=1 Tax=Flagellimonas sp. TaxID=2058762 RepID=UPI003B51328E